MSAVVDLRKTDDPRDAIHQAVQLLVKGGVVALPTETGYASCAHALASSAVLRVAKLSGEDHLTLLVKSVDEAIDYVPWIDKFGDRLARRCWPGPVTLVFDIERENDTGGGLLQSFAPEVRDALLPDGRVWLRVPAHDCVQEAGRLTPAPLVSGGESDANGRPLATADQVVLALDDHVDLVIDDGDCRYAQPATVVHVGPGTWSVLRPGVVTKTMVGRLASQLFIFICTGNTCRSPLAEGLFRKMLADSLSCAEDELSDKGYVILSAGIAADAGLPASPEAVEVVKRYGVDLRAHESQLVNGRLLAHADRVFAMTAGHRDALLSSYPDLAERVELLARDGTDISDPIGAGKEEYESCVVEIERHLRTILECLKENS